MNNLKKRVLGERYDKLKDKITKSGNIYNVEFVSLESKKRYLIVDNDGIEIIEKFHFILNYVPKFGKFEIEEFVGHKMIEALFVTKDLTELLNSELLCDDSPFNITRVSSERIKEKVLKCFDVIQGKSSDDNVIYLKFKWKEYNELEEES